MVMFKKPKSRKSPTGMQFISLFNNKRERLNKVFVLIEE
jgi:hypothetical protein